MFIGHGHLDIIVSALVSAIPTHNRTSCNSPEKIFHSKLIREIREILHLEKIIRYTIFVCCDVCVCVYACMYVHVYLYMYVM